MYTLLLGNKAYSSWSLRGWLLFRAFEIPVEEQVVEMYSTAFEDFQARHAPARQVPTLIWADGEHRRTLWDSLAIAEFLAERHPEAGHWPADPAARAVARTLAAEMHSSFQALRSNMPMNLKRHFPGRGRGPGVAEDLERLWTLWRWARAAHGGGRYLFGDRFTAADAFFTPVALRFEAYAVEAPEDLAAYVAALQSAPGLEMWREAAAKEPWIEPRYDLAAPQK